MMHTLIQDTVHSIEHEEDVRIVYACESGSRAWGFPSADSDYDVRFIYIHPRDWYLSVDVEHRRDVIERPISDQLDVSGWEICKALRLLKKSNPPLLEWLGSPIVYRDDCGVAGEIKKLLPIYYSPTASFYHYLHMAQGNLRDYLRGDTVWIKKYFYVLRPLLAMKWIEEGRGVVPMEFGALVDQVVTDGALRQAIEKLIERKKRGEELDRQPRIAAISDFIESEMARLEARVIVPVQGPHGTAALDDLFRRTLDTVWS